MTPEPDRQNARVWLMLVVAGAILTLVGWYRWLT